jgi:hypothetical protein
MSTKIDTTSREETVEEFLARGCRIQRIEHYPDPEGRVLFRGQRERQRQFNPRFFPSRDGGRKTIGLRPRSKW